MAVDISTLGPYTMNHPCTWPERMQTVISTVVGPPYELDRFIFPKHDRDVVLQLRDRRPFERDKSMADVGWPDRHYEAYRTAGMNWPPTDVPEHVLDPGANRIAHRLTGAHAIVRT